MEPSRAVPLGSFYIILQGAAQYAVYFLAYVALTRILNPSEIGELPILTSIYTVFSTITLFALDTATTKYVSQHALSGYENKVAGITWTAVKIVAALSISGFLVVALIHAQINKLIFGASLGSADLLLVILAAVIGNLGTILVAMLWGLNLFGQMVKANIVGGITSRVIGIVLAASPLRLEGYFIGWIIGNTLMLLIAFAYARPHLTETIDGIPAPTMFVYSYPILFSALVGLVQQWADITILYWATGSLVYTGAYYLGQYGATVLSPIADSISNAVFPTLSSKHGRADDESFRNALRIAQRALNVLVIPASFGLAAIAPTAVMVAYGGAYSRATIPFAILIISSIFTAYQALMNTVLKSITKTQPLLKVASVAAVTEVILTATLVVSLNVIGSALGRLAMVLVSVILTYWYVRGEWWPPLDKQQLMKCLVLSVIVGAALYGFDSYLLSRLAVSSLTRLLLDTGLFAIAYVTGLVALKPLHAEDIDLLRVAIPRPLHRPLRVLERRIVRSEPL